MKLVQLNEIVIFCWNTRMFSMLKNKWNSMLFEFEIRKNCSLQLKRQKKSAIHKQIFAHLNFSTHFNCTCQNHLKIFHPLWIFTITSLLKHFPLKIHIIVDSIRTYHKIIPTISSLQNQQAENQNEKLRPKEEVHHHTQGQDSSRKKNTSNIQNEGNFVKVPYKYYHVESIHE